MAHFDPLLLGFVSLFEWTPSRREERDFASCQGLNLMVTLPSRSIQGTEQTFLLP